MGNSPLQGSGENLEFTKEAVAKYVQDPSVCPFCGEFGFVEGDSQDMESGTISNRVKCANCHERWWEVYKISSIEPVIP